MTLLTHAHGLPTTPLRAPVLDTPQALQRFMGADFALSDQQFAVVRAPLEPAVVIAGAGSGKTTLMAARVVWLVGSGLVEPHEVLGLTFTTKAAAELTSRIREALRDAGLLAPGAARGPHEVGTGEADAPETLEPTVATYNAYAASLLTEHGLRIGHEPDTRVMAEAARYQLAARVIGRHTRDVRHLSDHQPTVVGYLLALDAQLSEHLVAPQDLLAFQDRLRPRIEAELAVATARKDLAAVLETFERRRELVHLVEEYRALKRSLGLMEFSDQIELGARLATTRPEVGAAQRAAYKVVLLDEYQDTSVAQARMLSALFSGRPRPRPWARPSRDRRRRPQPGDLRLARRLGLEHPPVRGELPVGRRVGRGVDVLPHGQPALGHAHPRCREPARAAAVRRAPSGPAPRGEAGRGSG